MIDLFALLDFDECPCGASNVFEEENTIIEFYLRVIPRNTFIKYQNLVRAMPSYLGAFLFDWEEGSLRAVWLLNYQLILLLFILFVLIYHGAHLLFEILLL